MAITEDYVSFEVAKLLKEKGFNELTRDFYRFENNIWIHRNTYEYDYFNLGMPRWENCYSCPTLQMAMKWLRKIHNIHIAIVPCEVGAGVMDYTYILYKVDTKNFIFKDLEIQGRANTDKMSASKTCEAAIKYCLENLI